MDFRFLILTSLMSLPERRGREGGSWCGGGRKERREREREMAVKEEEGSVNEAWTKRAEKNKRGPLTRN